MNYRKTSADLSVVISPEIFVVISVIDNDM